jgi:predicted acetyltransferase
MATYRPVAATDRDRFEEILQHAFAIEQGPSRDKQADVDDSAPEYWNDSDEWPPTLSEPRGIFEGDRLVSVCKLYYLDAYLHDDFVTVGGLGGVATPPEHRREGHVCTLAAGALAEYRENGITHVALWPFDTGFYRHLGWGIANKYTRYELPPDGLSFARGADGRIRRLGPDDWERLRPVEVAFGEGTNLSVRRSGTWWRERTLSDWPDDERPYVYGYERGGDLQGYVLYTVDSGDDGRRLNVSTLAHTDEEAYLGLLGFLSDHDSQVGTVVLWRALETELLDRVSAPEEVECVVEPGPMVRLTDVATAVERYPWPDSVDVRFTLDVSDPLLDHNDGRFEVSVADGNATATALETSDAGPEADVSADIATLSQLSVGTHNPREAARLSDLDIRRETLADPLSRAFPGKPVCLREFF